jgi:hypothetical protein
VSELSPAESRLSPIRQRATSPGLTAPRQSVSALRRSDKFQAISYEPVTLSTNTYFPSLINLPYHQPIAMATRDLPSIYSSISLSTDPYTTHFGASTRRGRPAKAYSDYGFIALLALTQRLEIDMLPTTWQASLGNIGQGGQAEINQALVNVQTSFAFKHFKRVD